MPSSRVLEEYFDSFFAEEPVDVEVSTAAVLKFVKGLHYQSLTRGAHGREKLQVRGSDNYFFRISSVQSQVFRSRFKRVYTTLISFNHIARATHVRCSRNFYVALKLIYKRANRQDSLLVRPLWVQHESESRLL